MQTWKGGNRAVEEGGRKEEEADGAGGEIKRRDECKDWGLTQHATRIKRRVAASAILSPTVSVAHPSD
jgi:hypothetical protein